MHRPGDIIDERYLLVKMLGLRAGAEMWEAEHEVVGRKVTLKFMPGNLDNDPEVQTLLVGEARASSTIGHPAVVEVYDVGATPDGEAFLVTETLRGETLADLVARKSWLKVADACLIAREVLSGLEAAHAAGVVHGQLRPDAIVLRNDSQGHVNIKILEFRAVDSNADSNAVQAISGSPSPTSRPADNSANRTRLGLVSRLHKDELSPYSAPELVLGPPNDPRSDLYSVGVMLLEMITGRVPEAGEIGSDLLFPIMDGSSSAARAAIPSALQKVLQVALAPSPERRHASARDMGVALEPFVSDSTSSVPLRESVMPLLSSEARRSRAMARLERAVLGVDGSHRPSASPRANLVVIDTARRPSVNAPPGVAVSAAARDRLPERAKDTVEVVTRTKAEPPARGFAPGLVDDVKVPPAPRTPACLQPFAPTSPSSGLRRGARALGTERSRKGSGARSAGRRRALALSDGLPPRWTLAALVAAAVIAGAWLAHLLHW